MLLTNGAISTHLPACHGHFVDTGEQKGIVSGYRIFHTKKESKTLMTTFSKREIGKKTLLLAKIDDRSLEIARYYTTFDGVCYVNLSKHGVKRLMNLKNGPISRIQAELCMDDYGLENFLKIEEKEQCQQQNILASGQKS